MKRLLGVAATAVLLVATAATATDLASLRGPVRASAVEGDSSGFMGMNTNILNIAISIAVLAYTVSEYRNRDESSSP
jgi:hypothetical protein